MKLIYKHWEKIIFAALLCMLVIALAALAGKTARYQQNIAQKMDSWDADVPGRQKLIKEQDTVKMIIVRIKKTFADFELKQIKRNIFARMLETTAGQPVMVAEPIFKLLEITYKSLGIQYRGRVVYESGKIIAQLNFDNKSYLVGIDSQVAGYEVVGLGKNHIHLKDNKRKTLKLKYQQAAYSEELVARIQECNSNQTVEVSKGSELFGYKVLDMDMKSVLLSKQGQHLKLEKGKVY